MSENTSKRSSVWMAVLLVLHAICGLVVLWLLLKLVPQYQKIFKDFNAKLPEMTIVVIHLSRFVGMYWYLLVPGLGLADFVVVFSLHRAGRTGLMTAWGVLVLLVGMLLIGLVLLATIVPLDSLITNLSGGKA